MPNEGPAETALDAGAQVVLTRTGSDDTSLAFTRNQRLGLLGLSVVAFALTWLLAHTLGFFATPGFGGSLLLDASPVGILTKTVIWVILVAAAATFGGRLIRPDVGLFAAAVALFAIRRSGGVTRDVYLYHPTAGTYTTLAVELVLLGLLFAALHYGVRRLVGMGHIADDADLDFVHAAPEPVGQKILAVFTQALVIAIILLITLRSDERMQVTAMVAIASILASICTVRFIPATPSVYFWAGPILVGVVGYLLAPTGGTANLAIGEPSGYFAPLARALPLDYASAGVAGAIYGYWLGRMWIPEEALEEKRTPTTKRAVAPAR